MDREHWDVCRALAKGLVGQVRQPWEESVMGTTWSLWHCRKNRAENGSAGTYPGAADPSGGPVDER